VAKVNQLPALLLSESSVWKARGLWDCSCHSLRFERASTECGYASELSCFHGQRLLAGSRWSSWLAAWLDW